MVAIPTNEALSGILWLFPSAVRLIHALCIRSDLGQGAVLIFAAIRSLVWYRFVGIAHWVIHAPMLISGVTLCLLGLLDLGNPTISLGPDGTQEGHSAIIDLTYHSLPLAIVMIVYIGTYYISWFVMSCVQRVKGGVYANAHESKWIAE